MVNRQCRLAPPTHVRGRFVLRGKPELSQLAIGVVHDGLADPKRWSLSRFGLYLDLHLQ
jgi:hypothetical protein